MSRQGKVVRISDEAFDLVMHSGKMGETFGEVLDRMLKIPMEKKAA